MIVFSILFFSNGSLCYRSICLWILLEFWYCRNFRRGLVFEDREASTSLSTGINFLKGENLNLEILHLFLQALVDCSWGFGNNGCDGKLLYRLAWCIDQRNYSILLGGEDFRVYQWMMKHGGIPSEETYGPYLGADGYCHVENVSLQAPIKGYVNVTSGDVDAVKVALFQHGPLSVAIDAAHKSFSFYANGVYYEPDCGKYSYRSSRFL